MGEYVACLCVVRHKFIRHSSWFILSVYVSMAPVDTLPRFPVLS
jgi:hypothetical protein